MICCSRRTETQFCPHCGRENADNRNLWGLVKHCRKTATDRINEGKRFRRMAEDGAKPEGRRQSTIEIAEKAEGLAVRWVAWADELEALLAREQMSEPMEAARA